VTLDLPLGSHVESMPREADMTPPGLADMIAEAVEALGLAEVTVVGNDTGGALTQILAARRPERSAATCAACSPGSSPATPSRRRFG
jgi:pimeloyl-ACP methyl ester carboxylesterase